MLKHAYSVYLLLSFELRG